MSERMSNGDMAASGITITPLFCPDGSVDGFLVRVQTSAYTGTNTCFFGKDHRTLNEAYVAGQAWAEGVLAGRGKAEPAEFKRSAS